MSRDFYDFHESFNSCTENTAKCPTFFCRITISANYDECRVKFTNISTWPKQFCPRKTLKLNTT